MTELLRRARDAGIATNVPVLTFASQVKRHLGANIPTNQSFEGFAAEALRHWPDNHATTGRTA